LLDTPAQIADFETFDRAMVSEKYRKDAEARGVPDDNKGYRKEPKEKVDSRPHQASGRQMEDFLAIRSSLREGFHR
jgi:hypothetical protein